ncbi:hypothetical protein [Sinobacterium caligoides]|nr:hypothetical protein [Sinobacterium caligoides]
MTKALQPTAAGLFLFLAPPPYFYRPDQGLTGIHFPLLHQYVTLTVSL